MIIEKFKVSTPLSIVAIFATLVFSYDVFAHAEHDKARFVAKTGKDLGFCDNALRPCKTISYAVQQANKGDSVLVASGEYQIDSTEMLFYLKSEIVPILAGFNRFDHFQTQSPQVNQTVLKGVPLEMANTLRQQGFTVIADGKSLIDNDASKQAAFKQKMAAYQSLNKAQTETACSNGRAGQFTCSNIDLLSHVPLSNFSSKPSAGNDIWGHVDLNTGREYAIMGVRNGATVFDLNDPTAPVEVGTVSGTNSTWRDIKVYQYFDTQDNLWKAYAYVTVDSAPDGVTIIDLNNLPNKITLVERNLSVTNAHNVYISNVDYTLNTRLDNVEPFLQLLGAGKFSGSFHSYSLENPETITIKQNQSSFNGYTHDSASVVIEDSRKDSDCVNATDSCTVFVDFNEKEILLWDITKPEDTRKLSSVGYSDVALVNQYIHSGWVTDDKRFVLVHDEFDENKGGLNSTVRIFQIDNLKAPVQVGQWTGPTRAIDHNGFVRGNRYYISNYERGLTVLDITDAANPVEVGFFDTFPSSDNASFNGAWGVYPFLPSGNILVSDINSGLYVLRDKTQSSTQGSVSFESQSVTTDQGKDLTINVARSGTNANSTSVSVAYEVLSGSAKMGSDFTDTTGVLNWNGNDSSVKSFTIPIANDPSGTEPDEQFFVRLFDPKSGVTLTSPSYLTVNVSGVVNTGVVEFASRDQSVTENSGALTIEVARLGGSSGAASVNYQLVDGTATQGSDFENTSGTLNWNDGELSTKIVSINLIDDTQDESSETFKVQLTGASGAALGSRAEITVTILDNESNQAPVVSVLNDFEVNTSQTASLTSTVSDPDDATDTLTFEWTQTSGVNVNIIDADQATATFVAPLSSGTLEFKLTVTDIKGAETSDNVTVTVVAPTVTPPDSGESSGGGGGSFAWLLLLLGALSIRKKHR